MSTRNRVIAAPPETVWSILADGWLYPVFVVGASRMREVDDTWPAAGARLHHSVGVWPALINDVTEVLEVESVSRLKLRAHGWPAGEAEVEFRLQRCSSGTDVTIDEDMVSGPGLLVPKPLRDVQLGWRNIETLRRLAFVAERRQR